MSKNIIIQQNGVNKNLTVDKLQIPNVGGGSDYWVPEESVALHSLDVSQNGTYTAASAGKYGYDYVSVSVPGSSVTGKGEDGNMHTITKDQSGMIVDTKIPSSLRVITPPDYIGPYGEGAYISFEGLSVEAMYADGTSAGVVPFSELQFPVTVAHYDPEAGLNEEKYSSVLLSGPVEATCIYGVFVTGIDHSVDPPREDRTRYIDVKSGYEFTAYYGEASFPTGPYTFGLISASSTYVEGSSYTYNGKTVYWGQRGWTGGINPKYEWRISPSPTYPLDKRPTSVATDVSDHEAIAWTMIYGDYMGESGGVRIPVQWARTGDGLVLETTFGINVVDVAPSGTND